MDFWVNWEDFLAVGPVKIIKNQNESLLNLSFKLKHN